MTEAATTEALVAPKRRFRVSDVDITLATEKDAQDLKALAESDGFTFENWEVDWTDVYPYWLLARIDGELVAALQTTVAKPFGRLEFLLVDPGIRHRERAVVVRELVKQGYIALGRQGCQAATGVIPFRMKSYKNVAERRGWRTLDSGDVMMKRFV